MIVDDFQDIDAVPAVAWARLAHDDLYSTVPWMRCAAPFAGEPHMLLDRAGAAASVGYLFTAAHPPAPFRRPDRVIATRYAEQTGNVIPHEEDLEYEVLPSLVLGGLRLHDSRILVEPSACPGRAAALTREFLAAARARAAELGARSVMVPYACGADRHLSSALSGNGYLPIPMGDAAYLDVNFPDMASYVAARPSSRRGRIRSEIRKLAAAGVRMRFRALTHEAAESLAPHEMETWRKHGVERSLEDSRRSLHSLAALTSGTPVAGTADLDGRLLAFTTAIHYRDELYIRNYGRLDIPDALPVYFGLVYYAHIEYALEHKIRRLYYGLKSEDAKRARGCTLIPQCGYIAPASPATRFPRWLHDALRRLTVPPLS